MGENGYLVEPDFALDRAEDGRPVAAHPLGVAPHHAEVGADGRREVDLVDDEQVGLRDARPALARDLRARARDRRPPPRDRGRVERR